MQPIIRRAVGAALLALVLGAAWRACIFFMSQTAINLFHKSITQGADVPMRAEMTMTWRRHGVTYTSEAHVVQGAHGSYRMEYVLPADARGRIVCSNGSTQWQLEPRRNVMATTPLIPETTQDERDTENLVAQNYKIVLVSDDEKTAGRPTYLIELLPRRDGKSSQKRWIDRETYKTLRVETHYPDGILSRMISYTSLTLPAVVSAADFAPPRTAGLRCLTSPVTANTLSVRSGRTSLEGLGLHTEGALGFRLTQVASSSVDQARTPQLLYSDGIETVSIFVQNGGLPALNSDAGWRPLRIMNRPAFEHLDGHIAAIVWTMDTHRFTAVSHLEPRALQAFVANQMAQPSGSSSTAALSH